MDWTPIFQHKAADYIQGDHWQLQFDDTIQEDQQNPGFTCSRCRRSWPSNRVTVIFHMHLNNNTHQGTVKVRRFRQNCKRCEAAPMEEPTIEPHDVDILIENLLKNIRKKCYHEIFDEPPREHVGMDVESPHEPNHCEGCIAGVCNRDAAMPRGRGFRGMPRGRGFRGMPRGRGYRGMPRGRGYRRY